MRLSTFSARVETATTKPFFREAFSELAASSPRPVIRNGRTATASLFANAGSRLPQQSIGLAEAGQGILVRTTA